METLLGTRSDMQDAAKSMKLNVSVVHLPTSRLRLVNGHESEIFPANRRGFLYGDAPQYEEGCARRLWEKK